MTEREQFEVEFVKLNYQWSDANKDKAFLGWQMARAQPAQAGQVLTEGEIVKCLVAAGCVGTVKMTYDSGPYEITRTSINADRFARAIEQAVMAKVGIVGKEGA